MPDTDFRIERFSAGHLPALTALYHAVYNRHAPQGYFEKKYDTAYTGKQFIGYIAYAPDGVAAGYYGVIPCMLLYNGETITAAQSADTMTHPGYRLKGMFVELSERSFALCRQEGINLLFGFPNQNSLHGAIHKLGWQLSHTMNAFHLPVRTLPFGRLGNKPGFSGKIYRLYRALILAKYRTFLRGIPPSVQENGYGTVYRSGAYLQQRAYSDHFVVRIGGVYVWMKTGAVIMVGDMDAGRHNFNQTIRSLKRLARWLGATEIRFQVSDGTQLHELLSQQSDPVPAFPVLFQQFAEGIDIKKFRFTFADIDIF